MVSFLHDTQETKRLKAINIFHSALSAFSFYVTIFEINTTQLTDSV